jgi:translation initiation factor 2 gamma subunit (eIF-2gamma)
MTAIQKVPGKFQQLLHLKVGFSRVSRCPRIPVAVCNTGMYNLDVLCQVIMEHFPKTSLPPLRNLHTNVFMNIVSSLDTNRPGIDLDSMVGGSIIVNLRSGTLRLDQEITISPGMIQDQSHVPLKTSIKKIIVVQSGDIITSAICGGFLQLQTTLDPALCAKNQLESHVR